VILKLRMEFWICKPSNAKNAEEVNMPDGVEYIGNCVFDGFKYQKN